MRSSRAGAARLSGERSAAAGRAVRLRSGSHTTTATTRTAAGRSMPVIASITRQVRVRIPPGARAPGSSTGRAVAGLHHHDRSRRPITGLRAGVERLSGERPAWPGGAGSSPALRSSEHTAALHATTAGSTRPRGGAHVVPDPVPPRARALPSGSSGGARVDEQLLLNHPGYHGGAYVHVFVEDTSRAGPARRLPSPRFRLEIADCTNHIRLEFDVETPGGRENSLYKIETLIGSLQRFRCRRTELRAARGGAARRPSSGRRHNHREEGPMAYLKRITARDAPQSVPIPGSTQVPNSAGGFTWAVDDWTRLRRFLVLGSEGGTLLRVGAEAHARERRRGRALHRRGRRRARSRDRRASASAARAEERPGALRAGDGGRCSATIATRRAALDALPRVARTGTHLFRFATFVEGFRGWGRSLRRAVGRWYAAQSVGRARLPGGEVPPARGRHAPRPAAAGPPGGSRSARVTRRSTSRTATLACSSGSSAAATATACRASSRASPARRRRRRTAETAALVREYGLPREALKPEHLTSPRVWEALLEDMPMTALIRNLATMTRIGLLAPGSDGTRTAVAQLGDGERLRRARVHPIAVLAALRTYAVRPRCPRPGRVDPGAGDRRRARRGVLRGVRERRAGRHAAAARARRVGLDAVRAAWPASRA